MTALLTVPPAEPVLLPERILPGAPRYATQVKALRQVEATMTWQLQTPMMSADDWIVFDPHLPALPGRQVNVRLTMFLPTKVVTELSPLRQPVMQSLLAANADPKSKVFVQVKYQA